MHVYLFPFLFWQSKHKEDTFATRPILLNEPELEVCLSLSFLHAFPLPCVIMCPISFSPFSFCVCMCIYIYIYVHHHLSCVLFFCPPLSFIFCVP